MGSHFLNQLLGGIEPLDQPVDVWADDTHRDLHASAEIIEPPRDLLIDGDVSRGHVLLVLLEVVEDTADGVAIRRHNRVGRGDATCMAALGPLESVKP